MFCVSLGHFGFVLGPKFVLLGLFFGTEPRDCQGATFSKLFILFHVERETLLSRSRQSRSYLCVVCVSLYSNLLSPLPPCCEFVQECGADGGRVKRPCTGLTHQSSVGVPWTTPYHLNTSTVQNVCIAFFVLVCGRFFILQCFDAVGWAAGRASGP